MRATEEQQKLMDGRKSLLGSKSSEEQLIAFCMTTQIMKFEDFIRDAERQLRVMD